MIRRMPSSFIDPPDRTGFFLLPTPDPPCSVEIPPQSAAVPLGQIHQFFEQLTGKAWFLFPARDRKNSLTKSGRIWNVYPVPNTRVTELTILLVTSALKERCASTIPTRADSGFTFGSNAMRPLHARHLFLPLLPACTGPPVQGKEKKNLNAP